MTIDIAKARELIRGIDNDYLEPSDIMAAAFELSNILKSTLDRIEQLQAALVEACDGWSCTAVCDVDADDAAIERLRSLAAGEEPA